MATFTVTRAGAHRARGGAFAPLLRALVFIAAFVGLCAANGSRAEAASYNCLATSKAAHALCFLDFSAYSGTANTPYNFTLSFTDGSTLTGTINNTGTSLASIAIPVYNQAALGNTAYVGLPATVKPAFYGPTTGRGAGPYTLSALTLKNSTGTALPNVTVAGLDAENTGIGDGGTSATNDPNGKLAMTWSTTGSDLIDLQVMPAVGTPSGLCTLDNGSTSAAFSNNSTQSAYCDPVNMDPSSAYILTSVLTPSQTFTMSSSSLNGQQAVAFAVDLTQLTVAKTVSSRETPSDQFQVRLVNGAGTTFASATTSGTGTTASANSVAVPGSAVTFQEVATSGVLSNYSSTYTCANAVTSGTTLPAANTAGTAVALTPATDDQITCTFTNTALTATSTPANATATDSGNISVTDLFTLKNASTIAGTIAVTTPTITSSTNGAVTPSGYTFGGATYATVAALNSAIAAAGPTAAGGTITVGVIYTTDGTNSGSTDTVNVPASVSAGTGTSPAATGTETDTISALPAMTTGSNCYEATGLNVHLICWLDFSGYAGVGSETFSLKMPDGSILTGTVSNTGTSSYTLAAAPVIAGVGLGTGAYTGIAGKPVFYQADPATKSPIQLSNLKLTDPNGYSVTTIGMGAADAERTGLTPNPEVLSWSTSGAAFTNLQLLPASPATSNVCTLSALGLNVTCTGATQDPVNAYLLRSILNTTASGTPSTINMSDTGNNGSQGFAYGIDLSLLTVTKTVSSRAATADQFTTTIGRATNVAAPAPIGTPVATATTTGSGTTATATTPFYVIPNENYLFSEAMAAGSPSALSQYATTVTCTNAMPTAGVTQVLPAANTPAQSVVIVPQPDSEITCAFTNVAVTMTNVPVAATATDPVATSETDKFTLTNTSSVAGTFTVATPTITPFTGTTAGTAFAPTGYTLTVGGTTTSYTTLAALNTAIAGMTPTAAAGSIVVGVTYTTTAGSTTSDVVSLPATLSSGTGTSPVATAAETDTLAQNAALTIAKTGTTNTSPGGLIQYSILVTNNGPSDANGATFSDPMPSGVTVKGTPACATTSGNAVCGTVTVSSGTPQTVSSTLTSLPANSSVTFTITASAATLCANASSPCTYTNTATVSDGAVATAQNSSLSTTVTTGNGLSKTVQNITQSGASGTSNTAKPGDVLQYVLTFANTTGQPVFGLTISDVVPTNTTYYTANTPVTCVVTQATGTPPACAAAYTSGTNTVSGTLPTKASGGSGLASGATVKLTFQVKVN